MKRHVLLSSLMIVLLLTMPIIAITLNAQQKEVRSPDGKIVVTFTGGENRKIAVEFNNRPVIVIHDPAMIIQGKKAGSWFIFGKNKNCKPGTAAADPGEKGPCKRSFQ